MKYALADILQLHKSELASVRSTLAAHPIADGAEPMINGLNGWVFEHIVRQCLVKELEVLGLHPQVQQQVAIKPRVKVDLLFGSAAIEVKAGGSFGSADQKYRDYRQHVEKKGWTYLYVSLYESHALFRAETINIFGADCTFYLDADSDWANLVRKVASLAGETPASKP